MLRTFFGSLEGGKCFYSAMSVRVLGNNSLTQLVRILTSLELFLNHEFYSRHPALTDEYSNDETVLRGKTFCILRMSVRTS